MPAGVVEPPDLAVVAAHHHDGIVADLQGEELPGRLDLAVVAGEDPLLVVDGLEVDGEELRIRVEAPREAEALATVAQLREHGAADGHETLLRTRAADEAWPAHGGRRPSWSSDVNTRD